jgi:prolyl oligopeptidase
MDMMPPSYRVIPLTVTLLVFAAPIAGQQLRYPPAPRSDMVDNYFGHMVPDPYRSLEDPDAPPTAAWVQAEHALTDGYVSRLARRDSIRQRLTVMWDYPKVQVPVREAGQIWFRKNSGLQKQFVLYRKVDLRAAAAVVLDPNSLSPDGSIAVSQWSVSPDGRTLAYTTAAGGSDLRDIHVRDLETGRERPDTLRRVKFTDISWTRDSKGFYYSRFRGSAERANLKDANTHHQLWYHPRGGRAERLVFERPDDSTAWVGGNVSDDGRWLFIYSGSGTTNNRLWIANLKDSRRPDLSAAPAAVVTAEDAFNIPLGVIGSSLYIYTNWQAPRGRVVAATVGDSVRAHWRPIITEGPDVISGTLLVGNRLVVTYLVDVQSRVRLFNLVGTMQREVPLPDVGTADNLSGRRDGSDFFFTFSSYLRPTTVYRYDLKSARLQPFEPSKAPFDPTPYETRATFFQSKDGTRIPIFITARKGLARNGGHPTLLYGYGGFDANLTPSYSPAVATWLELGGVYAVPNLRGGGEYGEAWHQAGMRGRKQNVFDDFIAAAEFLVREGYATPNTLAIRGGSNGGLLVGAAITQRPDLFAVALPAVGVMDMLRFQKFTGGQLWVEEYGSSDDSTAVSHLLAYSPLHNLKPGTCYPATLVTTADHDDRVVPSHSFKFAATLQAAQGCTRPVLLRVEKAGSHGYRPTDRIISEIADVYAFALANLGGAVP